MSAYNIATLMLRPVCIAVTVLALYALYAVIGPLLSTPIIALLMLATSMVMRRRRSIKRTGANGIPIQMTAIHAALILAPIALIAWFQFHGYEGILRWSTPVNLTVIWVVASLYGIVVDVLTERIETHQSAEPSRPA